MSMKTGDVKVVIGAQWGDEGKGKVVDLLAESVDLVCRGQVNSNLGLFIMPKSFAADLVARYG